MPALQSGLWLGWLQPPRPASRALVLSTINNPKRPLHTQTSTVQNNANIRVIRKQQAFDCCPRAPLPRCWVSLGQIFVGSGRGELPSCPILLIWEMQEAASPHSVPVLSSMPCRSSGSAKIIASI